VSVDSGASRIDWADAQMPVLRSVRERFAVERPLQGVKVGACLHVTAETANLVRTLAAGGAEVALCAPNPLSTQDDVAAVLGEEMLVRAAHGTDPRLGISEVAAWGPRVTLDDGADLIALLHEGDALVDGFLGATEETTTGLVRVRQLTLRCPVLALNEAQTERVFNDHYGTGQSTLDGILRATNILFAGRTVVVCGYGFAGRGIATRARGAGAHVIVCEVDPLAALTARMEGFEVMPSLEAAARGGAKRVVHCSTVGVHGDVRHPPANESAPLAPGDVYQITKLEGEQLAREAGQRNGVEVTIVRPSGIYGPGDRRLLRLFRGIVRRRWVTLGRGEIYYHLTYIDDLVEGFRLCGEHAAAANRTYIIAGGEVTTLNALVKLIADAAEVREPRVHLPVWPFWIAGAACEAICARLGVEPPIYRRRVDFFTKSRAFDITRARVEIGYAPQVGLRDGIRRTLEWYRAHGWI
jgi:nucleoside-diphosphate-sugar epimerase